MKYSALFALPILYSAASFAGPEFNQNTERWYIGKYSSYDYGHNEHEVKVDYLPMVSAQGNSFDFTMVLYSQTSMFLYRKLDCGNDLDSISFMPIKVNGRDILFSGYCRDDNLFYGTPFNKLDKQYVINEFIKKRKVVYHWKSGDDQLETVFSAIGFTKLYRQAKKD